ncbi:hypothetical protein PVAND_002880 [Polypedilum vanderplanki]|uniref:Uncharacterized protein n=1 Tax=Polypedilum vanderplanki TaxID=319348 RepID=A0A9J6BSS6_POLVA|nr:hypothetical protein PVAND_002880 [Polypedilum vanderplanki]
MKTFTFLLVATLATVAFSYPQQVANTVEQLKVVPAIIGDGIKSIGKELIDSAVDSHQRAIGTVANVIRNAEQLGPPLPPIASKARRELDS